MKAGYPRLDRENKDTVRDKDASDNVVERHVRASRVTLYESTVLAFLDDRLGNLQEP